MKRIMVLTVFCAAILTLTQVCARADNLIAYYSFNSGNGNANDDSGHGFDGTVYGAVPTNDGYLGKAFDFNGADAYIQIPNLDINTGVYPQLTMGAWVKPVDANPIRQIISQDNSDYDRSLGIDDRQQGGTGWSTFTGQYNGVLGGFPVTTDKWAFVAVAYDENNEITHNALLYVDGATISGFTSFNAGHTFTNIGHNPDFGEYFSGTIDEVFFFNKALTSQELDNIRANGVKAVPEPISSTLFLLGGGALFLRRRFKKGGVR